ncbi:hypothetical protein C3E97_013820 [Pseudomonas sp. MWU12-2115]|nr:hypothetical protein C3E97_013820 [Pseudomonas sp. MWU12-2115]
MLLRLLKTGTAKVGQQASVEVAQGVQQVFEMFALVTDFTAQILAPFGSGGPGRGRGFLTWARGFGHTRWRFECGVARIHEASRARSRK